jgi:colanic acid biosynthesis glycosyl transferase WcaI
VTVLTGFPNHPTGVIPPAYAAARRKLLMRENVDGIRVVRTWLLARPNRRASERILSYLSFCISAAITGTFLSRPDVVIATSPQPLTGISGWWTSVVKRTKFVFEVRDLWPESLEATGTTSTKSSMYRWTSRLVRFLYRRSDHIVAVSPAIRDAIVSDWGIADDRVSTVTNGVDVELFFPIDQEEAKRTLSLSGKFVVLYSGTHGSAHGLQTVLDAAAKLEAELPDVQFLFVGEGSEKEVLVRSADEMGLKNVTFLPEQPRDTIPTFLGASDIGLVVLKKAKAFETVIPTKMLEIMACGRPVLLAVDGQAREIVDQAEAGIFAEPEDAEALADRISRLYHDRDLRESLGRNGHKHIEEQWTRAVTADRYIEILNRVVGSR